MRIDGYAPIEDYALIGDGRTAALVARDGAIDWLCLPNLDSPSVCAAIVDARRGGTFELQPSISFRSSRRYLSNTNVLETTFTTDQGSVRVVDAMTLPDRRLEAMREIVRSIEGLSGAVPMRWRFAPRFNYGRALPSCEWRDGIPVATWQSEAVAVRGWDAGQPAWLDHAVGAEFEIRAGGQAMLALVGAYAEPLIFPPRRALEKRLAGTIRFWQEWIAGRQYQGPWSEQVARSALVLKALIFSPSGASVAAPTTSLPEEIGGSRNWDYRFCWLRDSNFLIDALLELGCYDEARSLFWWFMHATALTEPELRVLYRLDGAIGVPECELPLDGYRGSRPVRIGNSAYGQRQLDIYGALFETAWLYSEGHHRLDDDTGVVLARIADRVCKIWRQPDSGIWEVRNGPFHFTHSKVMCWVALDRAVRLAERGELPRRHAARWKHEAAAIEHYVETQCWSDRLRSYTRVAGQSEDGAVDASLLMLPLVGYKAGGRGAAERINGTIDAVNRELRHGDFVYRYKADDGVPGGEGCFLNCSFWLVEALVHAGRTQEAEQLMEALLARANDVGLYSEEVDPRTGAFLGNLPQALVHLALISAAAAFRAPLA
jgi:GH15 family glucan-1,4-alpha-glucosidase